MWANAAQHSQELGFCRAFLRFNWRAMFNLHSDSPRNPGSLACRHVQQCQQWITTNSLLEYCSHNGIVLSDFSYKSLAISIEGSFLSALADCILYAESKKTKIRKNFHNIKSHVKQSLQHGPCFLIFETFWVARKEIAAFFLFFSSKTTYLEAQCRCIPNEWILFNTLCALFIFQNM